MYKCKQNVYRQKTCKHNTNRKHKAVVGKYEKRIHKIQKRNYDKYDKNYNDTVKIENDSEEQFMNVKLTTLALGNIFINYYYYEFLIGNEVFYCKVCGMGYIGKISGFVLFNNHIDVCNICKSKVDEKYEIIKTSIIRKFICIKYILSKLLLQDLYVDTTIDYFILTLTHNTKVTRELFIQP